MIQDSHIFNADTRLIASYGVASQDADLGTVAVPWKRSGQYAYYNCNVDLGSLTLTKIECHTTNYSYRFTCTGSGTWVGKISYSAGFASSGTTDITLKPGTVTVSNIDGSSIDNVPLLAAAIVNGNSISGSISSITMRLVAK